MLISVVQQDDSAIYVHTHLSLLSLFSVLVYHKVLTIVPCALWDDLVAQPHSASATSLLQPVIFVDLREENLAGRRRSVIE